MKKFLISLVVGMVVVGFTQPVYATFCFGNKCKTDGNVMDSNKGSEGDILTYDCHKGNTDVGKWVDPKDIPELKGEKGDTGELGVDGTNGADGQDGYSGVDGVDGEDGKKGVDGSDGQDGERGNQGKQGLQGKGLKDRREVQYEGVIKSWKRVDLSCYYIHDFNNDIDTVGIKIKHYFGKSWSERELEKVNDRLKKLENKE